MRGEAPRLVTTIRRRLPSPSRALISPWEKRSVQECSGQ
jgi:hypothetical protein